MNPHHKNCAPRWRDPGKRVLKATLHPRFGGKERFSVVREGGWAKGAVTTRGKIAEKKASVARRKSKKATTTRCMGSR